MTAVFFYLISILSVCIFSVNAFAQTPKAPEATAAVWDLNNLSKSALSDETVQALTLYIRVKAFQDMPGYRWIERGRMKEVLDEQKFQASGCTDQSCVVEMGQLLGARKMVSGAVSKTGGDYNLTLSVIDIETGLIEKSAVETCRDCDENKLYQAADKAVLDLAGKSPAQAAEAEYAGPLRGGRMDLDLNYLGGGLRVFLSRGWAVEGRFQHAEEKVSDVSGVSVGSRRVVNITGGRLYWYPTPSAPTFSPYLCLEGGYVKFKGAFSKGTGLTGGGFAGIEYFLGRSLSVQTDIGIIHTQVEDKAYSISDSGFDFVLNLGVNIYFSK